MQEVSTMAFPATQLTDAYERGYPALLVTGRSAYDLVLQDGNMKTFLAAFRASCASRGMLLVSYARALGLDWDAPRIAHAKDRTKIETILNAHGLGASQQATPSEDTDVTCVLRGIGSLARMPADNLTWSDGSPLRFAFWIQFAEHLVPNSAASGMQTEEQQAAIELAYVLGQSLALRKSGNLVVFHARPGMIDSLAASALHHVRLAQPSIGEKTAFLQHARGLYTQARYATGMSDESVARLTANTPNRGLENLLRASHVVQEPLTAKQLIAQKSADVEQLSEQTLTVLDTRGTDKLKLHGVNIAHPDTLLRQYAENLARGNTSMPANVILAGPPGTGKTDLARLTARQARVSAYTMHSPKAGIVGETERRALLQQTVLKEWAPNVAFVDEITEAFPMERGGFDGDSGASRSVTATLLTALSDESRRGRSLLIATTNCPWRIGAAMRSRFTFIPVLYPLQRDFAGILQTILKRLLPEATTDTDHVAFQEAAELFYLKGASPRHMLGALSHMMLCNEQPGVRDIRQAAIDFCSPADLNAVFYADLWAVKATSSLAFFPWYQQAKTYPFPAHLVDIVDKNTGQILYQPLEEKLQELAPSANV